jgi:hypothetical protein
MKITDFGSTVGATASAVFFAGAASAATFSGYDNNTSSPLAPLTTATSPNSQAAFANFSSNLNGATVTTESFETNATPLSTGIDGLSTSISGTTATFSYTKKSDGIAVRVPVRTYNGS